MHEIASLIEVSAIAASAVTKSLGLVLFGIHPGSVLDVVVGVIRDVEDLRLKGNYVALGEVEAAGQSEVDLLRPRSVERIQSGKRARAAGINTESGVWRTLQRGGVVDGIRQCADVEQRRVRPSGGKLHGRADCPVRERATQQT